MRYLIMGAGALGTVFGGLLQQAGHPVAFLGRGAHFQQLTTKGGLIDGIWGGTAWLRWPCPDPETFTMSFF
ncbi:MAG: 2-dehydropantoate 2-reductase N-terminal domain-containing protein [Syntrophobacterales bacterium]|jgi:ketopantoate reductase